MFNSSATTAATNAVYEAVFPLQGLANLSNTYLILLALVNLPVIIIALNVLRQLVVRRDRSLPPEVFHFIPIFGSAAAYGNDPINFFLKCREKYGNVFTFILLGRRMTVALGPKGNNFILGARTSQVSAEEAYTHLTTPVFGKDVVYDVPNPVLMEQKRFVKFGLSIENFRSYVPMIVDEVETFLKTDASFAVFAMNDINEWGKFQALDTLSEITILTAARTLQGAEVRSNMDKTFAQWMMDLDNGFTPINFMFPNLPLPSYRRRDKAQQSFSDFYVNILNKRKEADAVYEHDMMAALMQQHYKNGRPLTDREIAHIMIALLMAGQHTSSATSSWTLLHIADRQDIQEKLYQEQVEFFGQGEGHFRELTFDELKDLPVLDSVIRETLRVHPPIHSMIRKVIDDIEVPATLGSPSENEPYVIPKGHFLLACPAASQVDPIEWPEANVWEPTRWTDPQGVAARAAKQYDDADGEKIDYGFGLVSKGTDSIYQPFGAGRHRCIGETFAYLQLSVIIATFVRNLELKIQHRVPDNNYHTMITLPKEPSGILYRRRRFD